MGCTAALLRQAAAGWRRRRLFVYEPPMSLVQDLRRLGRAVTPTWARRAVGRALHGLGKARSAAVDALDARLHRDPPPVDAIAPGPLIYTGFVDEVMGLGRAGRLAVSAIEAAGLPVIAQPIRPILNFVGPLASARLPTDRDGGVWILHCNPPEARIVLANIRRRHWRRRYLIGYWAWELQELPEDWKALVPEFHEIWVLSEFMAEAVRPYARRVRVMWPRSPDVAGVAPDPARFGFDAGPVHFAAFADVRSALMRKNPAGAIAAFKAGFPEPSGRAALTLKLVEPSADPAGVAGLRAAAEGRPDIRFFEARLTDADMAAFMASLDVLVSLHRSEGFGLTIAEAMAVKKPAVATGWSSNLDFTSGAAAETLVPYTLVPVQDSSGRYELGQWAEPDIAAAGALMRRLADDPAFRTRVGEAGPGSIAVLDTPWRPETLRAEPWARLVDRPA
jgi:glycosyltransferase involved in cell wall biosynthesis